MRQRDWIVPYVKQYKYRMLSILLLSMLTVGSAGALMFTSGYLISKASLQPETILLVYVPIVLVRAFGLGRSVFRYSERLVSHDFILRVLAKMRTRLYHLVEPKVGASLRYKTGEILGVLAEDIEGLQDLFLRTVLPTASTLLLYILTVIGLGFFSIPFALLMAMYLFLLVVAMPLFSLFHMKAVHQAYKKQKNDVYQYVTDGFLGISDWLMSGQKKNFFDRYYQMEQRLDQMGRRTKTWTYYREFVGQLVIAAMIVSMICFAASLVSNDQLAGVFIAAFVLVVFPLSEALLPVSNAVEKYPRYEESLNRVTQLENECAESVSGVNKQEAYTASLSDITINMNGLHFSYEGDTMEALKDVTFSAKQGKKIAIIGKSGAGKSTLLKLLQGVLSPTNGTVSINGFEASAITNDTPKLISVLNQNPYLFYTSVANNLLLANEHASEEEIIEVMKKVKLHDYIRSLPDGYNTSVHETGQRFSGGERQRIALARVLLQDTPVVMLDEPTVGLDPITEHDLLSTIFRTLEGKTLIWVTHHLVGMENMDEIVFFEEGRIKMRGSHQELLHESEHYRKLYELDHPMHLEEVK
ncbi:MULTISPECIES: thiol reductant ABC exporter subunit CydC [Bacillus]|uniref:ATP-binding protein n=2 Tax=Bacillus TaxID=1386 RepID=A0A0M5JAY0_9BACI|nr:MULTISPECIES: thiol reductant ABC exporter subunit CydC [Bacillus]ALC80294.1 ATP-binding protein [Bacillus gobiensis]MBP1083873.1 ATP-binding cassette subfamily C protein CydC [Bacillus capparidis]MED1098354.1 thiol reductant ABC exporter subunit CydC [Bacillus capparidis]